MKMLILKKLQITVPQESEIEGNVIFRALCLLWPAYISEEEGRSFYTQQTRMSILSFICLPTGDSSVYTCLNT